MLLKKRKGSKPGAGKFACKRVKKSASGGTGFPSRKICHGFRLWLEYQAIHRKKAENKGMSMSALATKIKPGFAKWKADHPKGASFC
jgi:ribosome-binding protein aMBF1 (putative translation factor)